MNDGGPAFARPTVLDHNGNAHAAGHPGMALRDYFAAAAMHAMLNNDIRREEMATVTNVAKDAYRMADAMLKEREKEMP